MKRKMKLDPIENYKEAPADMDFNEKDLVEVLDLLPPPDKLVLKKAKKIKVTMDLMEYDIDFFKSHAKRLGVPYQSMIRSVIDKYVTIAKARSGMK
jgi:predicted DNA binding CopG/RHH family protein